MEELREARRRCSRHRAAERVRSRSRAGREFVPALGRGERGHARPRAERKGPCPP